MKKPYIHRDISWLAFNYRVLQEAKDKSVPLFERLKFLAIYSSNLDEFFKVRVANHRNIVRAVGNPSELQFNPAKVLEQIQNIVKDQQEEFSSIYKKELLPELKENGIKILKSGKLNEEQLEFIENYFVNFMQPYIQPMLLVGQKIKPFLNTGSLYLALNMEDVADRKGANQYAIVPIPSKELPRFIELPSEENHHLILLDDIVRHNVKAIFPGYKIINSFSIKLTRDAELYIDDEYSGDLIAKIQRSLNKRNVGVASRLVYDRRMPKEMLEYFIHAFGLNDYDLLPEGRYHNNSDFFQFPNFGMEHLENVPMPPLKFRELEDADNIFEEIKQKDHLIHVPYHSYEAVIKFFEDAANDPNVTHIKIIQYRVASTSRIMQALMQAVKNGKQVSAFVEVKARFDEESNLRWGAALEDAGVAVYYSMPGLKVHSKTAIVRRIEDSGSKLYTYLSTGNFHEKTAKIYSDIGIFTCDERLTSEAARVMTYLETKKTPEKPFEYMGVGQFNLNEKLENLIDREIQNHKAGKPAFITLKMNSLQDEEMINMLYKASKAGVQIKLIIRGICSLVPGVEGVSDNILAISIVDRFLEHARVFWFHNDGNDEVYLSSADLMSRNLHRRIETMFPVLDDHLKKVIIDLIKIQLNDNVKSRYIDYKNNNTYRKTGNDIAIRSQVETYYYIKRIKDHQEIENEIEAENI